MPRNDQDSHNTPDPQRWAFKKRREKLMSATAVTAGVAVYFYVAAAVFPPALLLSVAALIGIKSATALMLAGDKEGKNKFAEHIEKFSNVLPLRLDHPQTHFISTISTKLKIRRPRVYCWKAPRLSILHILPSMPIYMWPWTALSVLSSKIRSKKREASQRTKESFMFSTYPESNILLTPMTPLPDNDAQHKIKPSIQQLYQNTFYARKPMEQRLEDSFILGHELAHIRLHSKGNYLTKIIDATTERTTTILLLLSATAGIGQGLGWSLFGLSALADGTLLAGSALLVAADICSRMGYNYASRIEEMQADRIGTRLIPDKDVAPSALLSMDLRALKDEKFMRPDKVPLRLMFRDLTSTHPSTIRRVWAVVQEGQKNPKGTCPYELSRQEWINALTSPARTAKQAPSLLHPE